MGGPPEARGMPFPAMWGSEKSNSADVAEPSSVECPNDEDVMFRLRAGDADALNYLLDRYARLVLHIAHRVVQDLGEAEEIVQDVFLQIYQKADLFDASRGTTKAWILQIAFHRSLDRKSYLGRRGFYTGTNVEGLSDSLSGKTDLDRELGAKINRAKLEKAFEDLPELQRRTLEMFFFEGLELREITDRLQESFGNVRHHFYRGLERLRESRFVQQLRDR
jgi:RNA polymerase sigma-70 factor (ECF subfamily)